MFLYDIEDLLNKCFDSYITGRLQNVVVNKLTTDTYYSLSGIPQGPLLGPKSFQIFRTDITNVLRCDHRFRFANDLKWLGESKYKIAYKYVKSFILNIPVKSSFCLSLHNQF